MWLMVMYNMTNMHVKLRFVVQILTLVLTALFCIGLVTFAITSYRTETVGLAYPVPPDPNSPEFDRFPVSVDPIAKEISEDPLIDWYVRQHLSLDVDYDRQDRLLDRAFGELAQLSILQQLASPVSRTLIVYPGERREQVLRRFGDILHWSVEEREAFSSQVVSALPAFADGKFFPGRYVVPKDATPEAVAALVLAEFESEVLARYDAQVESYVPLHDALTIASLLEREAYDFTDMRIISGIIWNRLFINMPLQLDATLQYARGTTDKAVWWPKVVPADKYVNSPYNTYQETGLPPSPIANPSLESIVAALNPRETDCLFYFHDTDGGFYCSPTYEGHVALLKEVYGQGR